jgi:hypothetical protein
VGPVTHHTLFGLDDYTTYYFAATAYDSNGNESGFSNEVVHLAQAPVIDDGANSGGGDPYDSTTDDGSYDNGGSLDPGDTYYEDPPLDDGSGSLDPPDAYYEDPSIDDGSASDPGESPAEYLMATVASVEYHTEGGRFSDAHLLITFTVLDTYGGPVSGASISFGLYQNGSSYLSGTLRTGANGTAVRKITNIPRGTYWAVITALDASELEWDGYYPENEFTK